MYRETDHPRRGIDGSGQSPSQWTEKQNIEPALTSLDSGAVPARGPAHLDRLVENYEVDESFPFPQANDLEKIAVVAEAVNHDVVTADGVADVLDMSKREGAYYASAAGYLGLIEAVGHGDHDLNTYTLTSLGSSMVELNTEERSALMGRMISLVPAVQTYREDGAEEVERGLGLDGLTGATVGRRAATISSWSNADRDQLFASRVADECEAASLSYSQAAVSCRSQISEARKKSASTEPKQGNICSSCFQQMPLSGVCDLC